MQNTTQTVFVWDFGPASEITRGSAFQWPVYENGNPPFNHWCPGCLKKG
jgi:hypothetical protein